MLLNLIAQDLGAGEGLALLDPHGDLAEAVLMHVPKHRINRFIYVIDYPSGLTVTYGRDIMGR